jgi:diguanylate cyclase (GGDEF)-like protein
LSHESMDQPLALIIEDDKSCVDLFTHVLGFVGYQTEIISEGDPALARLGEVVPDLVLLDLNLPPGPPGVEILHLIRSRPALVDVPVLIITAHPHIAQEIRDGADLVLIKPFSAGQLRNLVSRFYPHEISRQLMQEAMIDPITNLPNKALLLHRLERAIDRAQRIPIYKFALLRIDFTQTPLFSPKLGRRKGDKLINNLTQKLRPLVRKTDTIAYIDRYEFAILLDVISNYDDAITVAKKLRSNLLPPLDYDGEKIDLVVEFSYTTSKDIYENPENYLDNALPIQLQTA